MRSFQPDDLSRLQAIRQATFQPVFSSFRDIVGERLAALAFGCADEEQAALLDEICRSGSVHQMLVCFVDGAIAAVAAFRTDSGARIGEIGLDAVHPDYAGEGVGTAMYLSVLERMKELGMAVATVTTGGDPSHAPARRAYEKAGFGPAIPSVSLYKLL
jgi:GNAT superfamily N-acetyltransferase